MAGTYRPQDVLLIVGVLPISGYADGTMITMQPVSDDFEVLKGADGKSYRSSIPDTDWTCEFTLAAGAPLNDALSALRAADVLTGRAAFIVLCKDGSGRSIHTGKVCWFTKAPERVYESKMSPVTWNIHMTEVTSFQGGNMSASII